MGAATRANNDLVLIVTIQTSGVLQPNRKIHESLFNVHALVESLVQR